MLNSQPLVIIIMAGLLSSSWWWWLAKYSWVLWRWWSWYTWVLTPSWPRYTWVLSPYGHGNTYGSARCDHHYSCVLSPWWPWYTVPGCSAHLDHGTSGCSAHHGHGHGYSWVLSTLWSQLLLGALSYCYFGMLSPWWLRLWLGCSACHDYGDKLIIAGCSTTGESGVRWSIPGVNGYA